MNTQTARVFEYDRWANIETLTALRKISAPPRRAMEVFAHIVAVHHLFLARIHGQPSPEVWPNPDGYDFGERLQGAYDQWPQLLARSADEPIQYVNSKGESWTSRLGDIAMHVVLHSAYHRGQIAMLIGQAGVTPPYTDFIQCTRSGMI